MSDTWYVVTEENSVFKKGSIVSFLGPGEARGEMFGASGKFREQGTLDCGTIPWTHVREIVDSHGFLDGDELVCVDAKDSMAGDLTIGKIYIAKKNSNGFAWVVNNSGRLIQHAGESFVKIKPPQPVRTPDDPSPPNPPAKQLIEPPKPEAVNHPSHYNFGKIEVIDALEEWGCGFCDGNVIKYVARFRHKNGVEDLKKARFYLNRLIQQEEKKEQQPCQNSKQRKGGDAATARS